MDVVVFTVVVVRMGEHMFNSVYGNDTTKKPIEINKTGMGQKSESGKNGALRLGDVNVVYQ